MKKIHAAAAACAVMLLGGCSGLKSAAPAGAAPELAGQTYVWTEGSKDEAKPAVTFGADGRLSGTSGCNRMIGSWKLEGTTLKLGRIGSTMMMCSPEAMKVEAAFLEKLGRASAATLLYRALGIPARYVIGYVGDTKAGQYVNILAQNAHAWVEVYVDGLGWVNVEVTGTSASSSWGDSEVTGLPIELSSESVSRAYNGEPLRGEVRLTGGSLLPGHTLTIGRQTQLTEVGKTANLFGDVRILDANGKDVTYLYAVLKSYGTLSVYARGVKLTTGSATKSYDGTPLVCRQYTLTDLCSGHRAVVVLSGTRTEIGRSENGVASVTIYD